MPQQFLHDFEFRAYASQQRRIRVTKTCASRCISGFQLSVQPAERICARSLVPNTVFDPYYACWQFLPSVKDVLRQRSFWVTTAGLFCLAYPLFFLVSWLPFYLVHDQHLSMHEMVHKAALYYSIDAGVAIATG